MTAPGRFDALVAELREHDIHEWHDTIRARDKRAADAIEVLQRDKAALRDALAFYADAGDYRLPYAGGKLYFDCGNHACAALKAAT
jgi:hypothetical protein